MTVNMYLYNGKMSNECLTNIVCVNRPGLKPDVGMQASTTLCRCQARVNVEAS